MFTHTVDALRRGEILRDRAVLALAALLVAFLWVMGFRLRAAAKEGRLLKGCRSLTGERQGGNLCLFAAALFTPAWFAALFLFQVMY